MKRKEPIRSDGDEDDVPLASLLPKPDTCIVSADVAVPIGEACIGLEVARDFGGSHGVCKGNIVNVDSNRRRPLYHIYCTQTVTKSTTTMKSYITPFN
jgi:hypothetical protein